MTLQSKPFKAGLPRIRQTPEACGLAELLWAEGFLVRDRFEDDANLRLSLDKASEGIPGTLYVTLMPTLACNLACTYCFQKESPAFNRMTDTTADATMEWIIRRVAESR